MNELEPSAVFEAAARATINERCAAAFLHDVRGSMQALFSAFELLGRSARSGGGNPLRVEKACDLAKRAITQHEKSTMEILGLLTLQQSAVALVDLGSLVREVVHFLRNDATTKGVTLTVDAGPGLSVRIARARVQTMLVGLLMAAIDNVQTESTLKVRVEQRDEEVLVIIPSNAALDLHATANQTDPANCLPRDLTLAFAQHLMTSSGGRLEFFSADTQGKTLRLYFPTAV